MDASGLDKLAQEVRDNISELAQMLVASINLFFFHTSHTFLSMIETNVTDIEVELRSSPRHSTQWPVVYLHAIPERGETHCLRLQQLRIWAPAFASQSSLGVPRFLSKPNILGNCDLCHDGLRGSI